MKNTDIPMKELHLNIEHQNIQVKEFSQVGYEFEKGNYVFVLIFPKDMFKKMGIKPTGGIFK